jgi:hypothetical protein
MEREKEVSTNKDDVYHCHFLKLWLTSMLGFEIYASQRFYVG